MMIKAMMNTMSNIRCMTNMLERKTIHKAITTIEQTAQIIRFLAICHQ